MTTGVLTGEQAGVQDPTHGRRVWVAVAAISMLVSLGLNVAHALVYKAPAAEGPVVVALSAFGHVVLGLLSGVLPVVMAGLMSHALFARAPGGVRFIVVMIFLIGMAMSVSAQYELMLPAVGAVRAAGTVAMVDVPALTALFMIERGNRARRAVELAAAERRRQEARERQAAAIRERQAADERERQAAVERLAAKQLESAQAAERAADAERKRAEALADAERQAAARAAAEQAAEVARAEADRLEVERQEAARAAAEQAEAAERQRAERLRVAQEAEVARQRTERERAERERAERAEAEARAEVERQERAERKALAEQARSGDLTPEQKKAVVRKALQEDPGIKAPSAVAAVVSMGGKLSEQRARALLAELRAEASGGLAEVRPLRSTATG